MVNNERRSGVSAAAPHELSVWKFVESRASELESLHTIISERLDNNFRSQRNKRRRTTGHDDRVAKMKLRKRRRVGVGNIGETNLASKDGMKVTRRVRRNIELKKNLSSCFGTSGNGTKRLRTHVWNAKRFTMKKLWGFYIPIGLHGRGRGSRSLLKKLKHGVLMHDASYYGPVQLEGPEDILMSVLSSVLVPSAPSGCEETSHNILAGSIFGSTMLHHAGKPCFPPIAPVTYMWRSQNGEQNTDDGTIIRQLWVWVHAAAFEEAYDSLSSACAKQTNTSRLAHCVSREGHLAKLELIGSKVFELLQKSLLPTNCNSERALIFENGHEISSNAVVSVVVKDPRTLTKKENAIVPEEKTHGLVSNDEFEIKEQTSSSLRKHETECVVQYSDLWDASEGVCPPVEESVLCMETHHQRKDFIRLGHKSSGPKSTVHGEYSRECPVVLLKNETSEDSVTRCSIILPLSWVRAFWMTFVSNGANAIGLREKQWVACEIGLPYFPVDFPDCNAYSNAMAMEAVETNQKANLRPLSIRPLEIPIPPPWNCVHLTLEKRSSKPEYPISQAAELDSENDLNHPGFEGVIARTSGILSDCMNNIGFDHLLLFPMKPDQTSNLNKFMRGDEFIKRDAVVSEVKCGKTLYYLRVLLRAYKEGVFEQGAVVCAPLPTDIMLWKSSLESDEQGLQIPQSSLNSYFTQLPSGIWQLQIPEDQSFHRWPIGFVTTGFVRGSKKATAGALCEASILSMLRDEQWKAVPVRQRKEIYVLVRNMRSTAYRLALATIVLEQQEKDVEFM